MDAEQHLGETQCEAVVADRLALGFEFNPSSRDSPLLGVM
jgi:hypothetical protein